MKNDFTTVANGYIVYFLVALSLAVSGVAFAIDQEQIKIIESNLSEEKDKYEKFDTREKDLLSEIATLEKEVSEKRTAVEALREKIRNEQNEIKKLGRTLSGLERSLKDVASKASKRLVVLYKHVRKGYLKVLVSCNDPQRFWQGMVYLKSISEFDRNEVELMLKECLHYNSEIGRIKDRIKKKEAREKEGNGRLVALKEDLEKKVIHLMRIHQEKEFYETAVEELQLAARDLKQELIRIEKKENYKGPFFSRFEDARKKLPFPLRGDVIKGAKLFADSAHDSDKGIFIEGVDSKIKAIFSGRVDFSGSLKGYGEVIIINHGSRYYTILAQLARRMKKEGDVVAAGDVIGLAAPVGKNKNTRLYFEIRRGAESLDPMAWLEME